MIRPDPVRTRFNCAAHALSFDANTGIPANRILVGGFSQGGALALHTGLTFNQTLAGVIALSCWLPIHKSFPDARKASENLPVFQCHGEVDPVVPYKFGQLSHVSLKSFMKNVQFNSYPGLSHTSSQQEMDDVKVCMRWLSVIHKRGRFVNGAPIFHFDSQDFLEKYVPPQ